MKNKKKIIVFNALLIAALFALVSLNKQYIRPACAHHATLSLLSGCFPNFIAAYLISLAPVSAAILRRPKYARLIVGATSILVFLILTYEETKPMWGASTTYDGWDIAASGLGALLAVLSYELINKASRKTHEPKP